MNTTTPIRTLHDRFNHPPRLLGVFAHPDDEVFCAGGALAQWTEAGGEAMIVSATRGEAGQIQDAHLAARPATRRTLGAVREQELRDGCAALGVGRVECFDYCDGALAEVDPATLTADVVSVIRAFQPDVVVTFGPDGGSGHPDHIAISDATTRACQLVAREDDWAPQLYYSMFPRQHGLLCQSLARWLVSQGEAFRGSAGFVRALTLLADEAALMGQADDAVRTQWFPADFTIVEQGERAASLYLIVSGHAQVIAEDADGTRRTLQTLDPGQFFGAEALAAHGAHQAALIASDTVTCLILSCQSPTAFDGRGERATWSDDPRGARATGEHAGLIRMDISGCLDRKVAALAAHRSQFAIAPDMEALAPVWQLLRREYFAPVALDAAATASYTERADDALELGMWSPLALPA